MTRKVFRGLLIFIVSYLFIAWVLFAYHVIWISPSYFDVDGYAGLEVPIMTMEEYHLIIHKHRRPYYYVIKTSKGTAHIMGVNHTNDPTHPHLDSLKLKWELAKPTVALVESRLGFLFRWTQDPIEKYGERGLTADLAKQNGCDLYTWEPDRETEVEYLLSKYPAKQLALFYVLRPYFSFSVNYREQQSVALLNKLIKERTDYTGLRRQIQSAQDISKMMEIDYPSFNWRQHQIHDGWPKGYLFDIWNDSNLFRDRHMIQCIVELVAMGETVFVTMGVSHAPRIERALKYEIRNHQ